MVGDLSEKNYGPEGRRNIDGVVKPHVEQDASHVATSSKAKSLPRIMTVVVSMGIATLLALLSVYFYQHRHKSVLSAPTKDQLSFPALVPKDGSLLNKDSIVYQSGTLSYQAKVGDAQIVVIEQGQPGNFSLNDYATKGVGISEINTFSIPAGQALTGTVLTNHVLIVSTGKTIVTATTPSTASFDVLHTFAQSLQKD